MRPEYLESLLITTNLAREYVLMKLSSSFVAINSDVGLTLLLRLLCGTLSLVISQPADVAMSCRRHLESYLFNQAYLSALAFHHPADDHWEIQRMMTLHIAFVSARLQDRVS